MEGRRSREEGDAHLLGFLFLKCQEHISPQLSLGGERGEKMMLLT